MCITFQMPLVYVKDWGMFREFEMRSTCYIATGFYPFEIHFNLIKQTANESSIT